MEETRKDGALPAEHSAYLPEGATVENSSVEAPASQPTPQSEQPSPAAESAQPAAAKPAAPVAQPRRAKKCGFSAGKVFLASLGAVVVGSLLTVGLWLIIFSGIGSMFGSTEKKTIPAEAILHIDFGEDIVDAPSMDPMAGFDLMSLTPISQLTLFDALRAVEAATTDDRIKGIYINLNGTGTASLTSLEELREAIERFKQSGKWVVAYSDTYSQIGYYLASVADKVYMQPEGSFEWAGLAMQTIFYKGLIDKLGVDIDILRPTVCKYKSAVEPYFLTEMSDANRQQMQELVNQMWAVVIDGVSASRGISSEELNRLADEMAVVLPQQALEHKMIDDVKYADQMETLFEEEYQIEEPAYVSLSEYASGLGVDTKRLSSPKVAIVYANGQVMDGEGTDDNIYGYTLSRTLKEVAEDDDVKAVVVRVNSPGGSALASDIIWREMENLKAEKPVIVSMGDYAASGGYYISAPADVIIADANTLTGSIGVFGLMFNAEKTLQNKLGVSIDVAKTNPSADMGSFHRGVTASEREFMMKGIEEVYSTFVNHVADGRNMTFDSVDAIGQGRVWTGNDGKRIGLVDEIGGLQYAIAVAAAKAECIDDYMVREAIGEPTGFMAIMDKFSAHISDRKMRKEMGIFYNDYCTLRALMENEGVQALALPIKIQ